MPPDRLLVQVSRGRSVEWASCPRAGRVLRTSQPRRCHEPSHPVDPGRGRRVVRRRDGRARPLRAARRPSSRRPAPRFPLGRVRSTGATPRCRSGSSAVIRRLAPTVVAVDAVKPAARGRRRRRAKPEEESGSGVLVRFDGVRGCYVVTNNHVVGGARPAEITVTLADGRILQPTRVWADPESDIALLQARRPTTCRPPSSATATGCASASGCWRSAARSA